MKKAIRQILLVIIPAVFTFGMTACSDSSVAVVNDNPVGVFLMKTLHTEQEDMTTEETGISGTLIINEDGTGALVVLDGELSLTWDKEKQVIISNGIEDPYEYKDGVFEWTMDDVVYVFERIEEKTEN